MAKNYSNRLYLVRHGENPANLTKEFSYKLVDYPLTPKGVLQAQQTADYFFNKNIHKIYTSPLQRAAQTAAIIAARLNLKVTTLENFREINVGRLEGQPPTAEAWAFHNQIWADWLNGKPETTFPGGENYVLLWRRLHAGLEQIARRNHNQNVIIVGHGGIFTCVLKELYLSADITGLLSQNYHNCAISELMLSFEQGQLKGQLVTWAAYTHLHGPAANLVSGIPESQKDKPLE
jgi:broad specificity phosphatase PhoE